MDCEKTIKEETILEQLKREALYAQRSFSTKLLYETYGKAQMARQLEALTQSEFMEINDMTVKYMNTDRAYIGHCNRKPFTPKPGQEYVSLAGAFYDCIENTDRSDVFVLREKSSGWTFEAHGVSIYEDGSINWDYSTGGHFESVERRG